MTKFHLERLLQLAAPLGVVAVGVVAMAGHAMPLWQMVTPLWQIC